ncbi:ferredoxin [Pseudonocardia sediminis]|uniref:Ferredoxin n=1 Tax=Pseudonocardia sediminis TaxID=1397368 RepID=A0A4Q7UXB1_PSEST|nr:ferredoxin [Pseudonocardia sediminis]RZT86697.1 ferredoxin [Pseudonocardia sediminis]
MRYFVDPALCAAHGQCAAVAPDVYDLDDEGYNALVGKHVDVPPELEASARAGAVACPESAIFVDEDGSV